ncbi:related to cel1 protein precursor [Cephalotrichum gorgonifer]|uniref:lytic cellulose monooxygenase (C4-dehydrogenating) n=1 Tax=Cephalotrichum gorgonifer TaxID=2041049 RepID=A0AAE8N8Q3_9PEZI|nr:related to cel1 protein precursor [Cephalotrichum gorgonifer]
MKLPLALNLVATGLLSGVSAHTIFLQLNVDGTTYDIGHGVRVPTYDGPQTNVNADVMACNGPPNPTTPSPHIIPVKAGSDVKAIWRHTLDSGPGDVMDPSHKGPVLAYLKKVDDATSDPGTGAGWFNIQKKGLEGSVWATDEVIKSGGEQVIHIPACIEDGQYLLRAEMIALHGAGSPGGAQFYMECAQIEVTGGSGSAKPELVSIPGVYPANHPGIVVNIYSGLSNGYQTPGSATLEC